MFRHKFALFMTVILLTLLALGSGNTNRLQSSDNTPEAALNTFFDDIRAHDWDAAYAMLSHSSNIDKWAFIRDVQGTQDSLKTLSSLQSATSKVLQKTDSEAKLRAELQWSTAVGAISESRDLKVVKEGSGWRVLWNVAAPPAV